MNRENKTLILGGSGYVGRNLFSAFDPHQAIATYNTTPFKDGVHFNSLSMDLDSIIEDEEPVSHAVILLGDTKPDSCATNLPKSRALNVESIKIILEALKKWRIKPVFASTEVVFDGTKGEYIESDEVNPILTYAQQKVEIETYIQKSFSDYLILRLALVYGSHSLDGTILTNWLKDIQNSRTSKCASDYICSPIYIDDVIKSTIALIELGSNGIFHVCGGKALSRLEIYEILLASIKEHYQMGLKPVPCSIHDFNTVEKRPLNVSMKPDKLVKTTGIELTGLDEICRNIVEDSVRNRKYDWGYSSC